MNRIIVIGALFAVAATLAFAQDSSSERRSMSSTGSSSADVRSSNASTTGTTRGTGTAGHDTNASTTGTLRGTGTLKKTGDTTATAGSHY